MGIIKADPPRIVAVMQGQRIGNSVRYLLTGSCYHRGLKLDPVALIQTEGNTDSCSYQIPTSSLKWVALTWGINSRALFLTKSTIP